MLQRQQVGAQVSARQQIVEGAVSMCEMAIQALEEKANITLSDDTKAEMVSRLVVVLCGDSKT